MAENVSKIETEGNETETITQTNSEKEKHVSKSHLAPPLPQQHNEVDQVSPNSEKPNHKRRVSRLILNRILVCWKRNKYVI